MDKKFIPCCYFPTTVVMVEDDLRFLKFAKLQIETKNHLAIKPFTDPLDALYYFTQEYQSQSFLERCIQKVEEESRDHRSIDVNIPAIHQEIENAKRFNQCFIMVVDFVMPNMNGLELCKQVKHSFIKKILLTGEADEKLAIDGFNQGWIHRFIRKDVPQALELLQEAINELLWQSFQEQSEIIIASLTKHPHYLPSCLDDPIFVDFFHQLIKKQAFTEFYLLDANGSFLFLDADAKPSWLIVKDEKEMQGWYDYMTYAENVSVSLLDSMQTNKKILYLHSEKDFMKPPADWENYLHPAKKLEGRHIYYYAYIDNPQAYDIKSDEILSYKAYLEK